jgi:excisionase family DNA binding protein
MTDSEDGRRAGKPKRAPRPGSSPLRNQERGPKLTLTIKEAAKRLGISLERGYEAAALGHIPTIPMGKRRVVPIAALERKLAGEEVEAGAA